jgi:hypothetical protein
MLQIFAEEKLIGREVIFNVPDTQKTYCKYLKAYWGTRLGQVQGQAAWDYVASAFPSTTAFSNEMVILEEEINLSKERVRDTLSFPWTTC